MTILVLAEHNNVELSIETAKALDAATQIGGEIHVLVAGFNAMAVAKQAAKLDNVAKVILAQSQELEHCLAEPVAALIMSLADNYNMFMSCASSNGKNIMPRVAALLDVMQISEIIEVLSADSFKRPIYAGNAILSVQSLDEKKVITVRTSSFSSVGTSNDAPIEEIAEPSEIGLSSFVNAQYSDSARPDLTAAKIVISGGRAFGSAEKFNELLNPLADRLGAAIGASRAAVDAGYANNDLQVGQTGKIVAPDLYIACGISGAIQHVAGMSSSKTIVAINKDADAPIFQIADYGLVADLFEALPELEKSL
ncbi:MAG: FAD-binding protein [Devosiaceae bacterium]|nr:FAD-binding protein [Devosiaceae bacterium]